jgi:hypothetical protein
MVEFKIFQQAMYTASAAMFVLNIGMIAKGKSIGL